MPYVSIKLFCIPSIFLLQMSSRNCPSFHPIFVPTASPHPTPPRWNLGIYVPFCYYHRLCLVSLSFSFFLPSSHSSSFSNCAAPLSSPIPPFPSSSYSLPPKSQSRSLHVHLARRQRRWQRRRRPRWRRRRQRQRRWQRRRRRRRQRRELTEQVWRCLSPSQSFFFPPPPSLFGLEDLG